MTRQYRHAEEQRLGCNESEPFAQCRKREDVGIGDRCGDAGRWQLTKEAYLVAEMQFGDAPFESGPLRAIAHDRERQRSPGYAEQAQRLEYEIEPLARHEPANGHDAATAAAGARELRGLDRHRLDDDALSIKSHHTRDALRQVRGHRGYDRGAAQYRARQGTAHCRALEQDNVHAVQRQHIGMAGEPCTDATRHPPVRMHDIEPLSCRETLEKPCLPPDEPSEPEDAGWRSERRQHRAPIGERFRARGGVANTGDGNSVAYFAATFSEIGRRDHMHAMTTRREAGCDPFQERARDVPIPAGIRVRHERDVKRKTSVRPQSPDLSQLGELHRRLRRVARA